MVYRIVMGTTKAIITIYSCLEAVDSAVLAKTGRKLLNRKILTKNGIFKKFSYYRRPLAMSDVYI